MNNKAKHKKNRFRSLVTYTLIVLVILFVVSTYLASGLVAKYSSSDSAFDSARVAKWDIDFTSGGTSLQAIVKSTHLESGSQGSWGLDITNKSEVYAQITKSSQIKLRLQSPDFDVDHEHNTWDFLHGINNPINFTVHMYNCSIEDLDNNEVSKEEVLIFDTASTTNPLTFQMIIEEGVLYYQSVINVGTLLDNDFLLATENGKACILVQWEVDVIDGAVDTNSEFNSYHVISTSEYLDHLDKYAGIVEKSSGTTLIEKADVNETVLNTNTFTYGSEKYVIAYKVHDYFEYLIYTSSLGGEIMISLIDNEAKPYIKRCTKLMEAEKTIVNNRTIADASSLEGLSNYVEKLEYQSYLAFETTKTNYDRNLGYLSLGLVCSIEFDLKVEQVD